MRPEILAPAGSMDALKAAVHAGADAVYLGGNQFGARAYADNFDEVSLIEAIEYAHIYGVKVYLTVNTLFRDEELSGLYHYLAPFYEAGLDAVIVQDFGVISAVFKWFPQLPIHASTQMTITTPYAFDILKDYGVTRIVPARELSMDEIVALKQTENVPEVEVFVQGALCYCYSGQCLMSSFLGGRSGNRGRCAQPCRLPYRVNGLDGRSVPASGEYLLSPKDLCGLEAIPELIRAGVDSFKIEGRMKKPEYVAAATRAYRKVTDACMDGTYCLQLVNTLKEELAEVFNRGGFTKGYYNQNNGARMMSVNTPGHCGVEVGTVTKLRKNQIQIRLNRNVNKGDILVVGSGDQAITLTCNTDSERETDIFLNTPRTKENLSGKKISRMLHYPLAQELQQYIHSESKIILTGRMRLEIGQQAVFSVSLERGGKEYIATVLGETVQKAKAKPMTKEIVLDKIIRTGGTRYEFESVSVELEEAAFYPLKALKDLRRQAIVQLEETILNQDRRQITSEQDIGFDADKEFRLAGLEKKVTDCTMPCNVLFVSTKEQLAIANRYRQNFSRVYVDLQYFSKGDIMDMIRQKMQVYYVLPAVLKGQSLRELESLPFDKMYGVVIRNLDELAYLKQIRYGGHVITDYSVYAMNRLALQWIDQQFPHGIITLPVELNQKQLCELPIAHAELEVYGYQQLMVSAQCLSATLNGCSHCDARYMLTDRMGKRFLVTAICKYCYNLIYNSVPTVLFDCLSKPLLQRCDLRLHFTGETKEEMETIIHAFLKHSVYEGEKTRGHYKRGVE